MRYLNNNLAKITELLNDGEFHNGTVIKQQLNISRTAVWKAIKN
ncbi:HTH domain-containing protein [Coxiella-like endosymbiont of Rhipicephalus sanguineus]|nr:HTH domain-containing protein [Coxiella-like endosymbiont of Rhipicephalus sanguineus]